MRDRRTLLAFFLCCTLWSLSWIFIKIGVQDFPPVLFAALRCVISAVFFVVYCRISRVPLRLQTVTHRVNFLVGLLFFGVPFLTIFIAERTVEASVAAVVFGCSPVLSVTLARIVLKEPLSRSRALAVLLGVGGVLYLYLPPLLQTGLRANLGLFLILAGTIAGSSGMILAKKRLLNENPATSLPNQMIQVAPVLLIASLLFENHAGWKLTPSFLVSLLYLAIFASGIAYALYFWLLKHMPVSQIIYIDFLYPILAIFFARVILGEPMSPRLVLSAAMILAGGLLASRH